MALFNFHIYVLEPTLIFFNTARNSWFHTNSILKLALHYILMRGHAGRSWLRHCSTRRNFADSIPSDVTGIFHWHNPAGRTMVLGST